MNGSSMDTLEKEVEDQKRDGQMKYVIRVGTI